MTVLCLVVEPNSTRALVAVLPTRRPPMDQPVAGPSVAGLVAAAREGDTEAWDQLVDRFLPLVHSVVSRVRLSAADAADVNQTVWLRLVEHLGSLRQPEALPGWLATTARREALRAATTSGRVVSVEPGAHLLEGVDDVDFDDLLVDQERDQAMRDALAELPADRRRLLELLVSEPPTPYDEISSILGMPIGSIGPTRARALAQLRKTRAFRAWHEATAGPDQDGGDRRVP
ncbi:sigma-70 family RNA polymerase sigma factor [Nocardioides bigeumensis]|uniref:RNA polymerase sigma factor n=1 Tax=Nocardioides bigeumensis TaxID=433657 RepID=UPI0031D0368A